MQVLSVGRETMLEGSVAHRDDDVDGREPVVVLRFACAEIQSVPASGFDCPRVDGIRRMGAGTGRRPSSQLVVPGGSELGSSGIGCTDERDGVEEGPSVRVQLVERLRRQCDIAAASVAF